MLNQALESPVLVTAELFFGRSLCSGPRLFSIMSLDVSSHCHMFFLSPRFFLLLVLFSLVIFSIFVLGQKKLTLLKNESTSYQVLWLQSNSPATYVNVYGFSFVDHQ